MNETKGGVSLSVLHCMFNIEGSVTHFMHDFDPELYRALPNLYVVCVLDNQVGLRSIPAGLFVKTSYSHEESGFVDAVYGLAVAAFGADLIESWKASFVPARLTVRGSEPLSEMEMVRVLCTQRLKHAGSGLRPS
ncbi:hypothetical protein [Lysobacter sp. FW306-1B-D06B]|uniref:hypothetical protein n=1 Tax=Lysobacter sp. FW306-1B-D06B TaxID=3140250 RepID=UPI0031403920